MRTTAPPSTRRKILRLQTARAIVRDARRRRGLCLVVALWTVSLLGCRPDPPAPPTLRNPDEVRSPPIDSTHEAAGGDTTSDAQGVPGAAEAPADETGTPPPATSAPSPATGDRGSSRRGPAQPEIFERGIASWYGPGFHGRRTANGERYDMNGISAAHKTLPFDTVVEVHNLDNGRRLEVRINDRGPFIAGRIIDLSRGAARKLDLVRAGVARVELRLISSPQAESSAAPPGARRTRIQVAAFRQRDRASALARQLREERSLKRWVEIQRSGGWHRVRLIGVPRNQVQDSLDRLRELGFDPLVLR